MRAKGVASTEITVGDRASRMRGAPAMARKAIRLPVLAMLKTERAAVGFLSSNRSVSR
jgi:hypothetical protein